MRKPPAIKDRWPFVEVRWFDAVSEDGWKKISKIKEPARCISRGWLVKETDWYVTLAGTIGDDDVVGEVLTIPRGMIAAAKKIRT
jgi:hypothetical protein